MFININYRGINIYIVLQGKYGDVNTPVRGVSDTGYQVHIAVNPGEHIYSVDLDLANITVVNTIRVCGLTVRIGRAKSIDERVTIGPYGNCGNQAVTCSRVSLTCGSLGYMSGSAGFYVHQLNWHHVWDF